MQKIKEKIKTRVVKLTTNQTVRIPTSFVKKLGLRRGSDFMVRSQDDSIVLTPLVSIPKSQAYFWTPEWQEAERQVDKEIAEGKLEVFDNIEDLIADLNS